MTYLITLTHVEINQTGPRHFTQQVAHENKACWNLLQPSPHFSWNSVSVRPTCWSWELPSPSRTGSSWCSSILPWPSSVRFTRSPVWSLPGTLFVEIWDDGWFNTDGVLRDRPGCRGSSKCAPSSVTDYFIVLNAWNLDLEQTPLTWGFWHYKQRLSFTYGKPKATATKLDSFIFDAFVWVGMTAA